MQLRQRKGSQSKSAAGVGGARRGTALKALKFTGPDKAQHDDALESVVVEAFERASKGESFAPAPARDATRSGNKALTLSPKKGFSTPVKVASPLSRASSAGAAPPPCALAPVRSSALPPLPPRASSSLPGSPSIYVNKGPSSQHSLPVKRRATSVDRPSSRGCNLFKGYVLDPAGAKRLRLTMSGSHFTAIDRGMRLLETRARCRVSHAFSDWAELCVSTKHPNVNPELMNLLDLARRSKHAAAIRANGSSAMQTFA